MKSKIIRYLILSYLALSLSFTLLPLTVTAQCPMCRMSAEADLKNGGSKGKGLNAGIVYMLVTPYIILGTIGYIWYRNVCKLQAADQYNALQILLEPHPNK